MKITYFTVSNYRSITTAYKIDLQNLTVLIGKNNEGKSNLIKALCLAMELIHDSCKVKQGKFISRQHYVWREDFPINLQKNKKLKNKETKFRLDFQFTSEETEQFHKKIGSVINGNLSVDICIKQDEKFTITIPKRGKNTKVLSEKINEVSSFICEKISVQYIPAIRSEADAYDVISNIIEEDFAQTIDVEYQKSVDYITKYQESRLAELSSQIKEPLAKFMPNIKDVQLQISNRYSRTRRYMADKRIEINVNDGVLTSLSHKGDGVKSLTTMAILSRIHTKSRIIIIDEPENHLHPEAIHYLNTIFTELSENNQVIISTHNPIFTNRLIMASNIIVSSGQAQAAKKVDEIRKCLGVMISDNLMYSEYVIVVEGPSDKEIICKKILLDEKLAPLLKSKYITVRSIGGTHNLQGELYNLERYLCKYLVILDNDSAAKVEINKIQGNKSIPFNSNRFRYFMLPLHKESELEDLYNQDIYKELLMENQIDISHSKFKNKARKWSTRLKELAVLSGQELSDETINEYKEKISQKVSGDLNGQFTTEASDLLDEIILKITSDIDELMYKNVTSS